MCEDDEVDDTFSCFVELYNKPGEKFDIPLLYSADYERGSSYYIPLLRIGESVTSSFLLEYIEADFKGPSKFVTIILSVSLW